MREKKFSLPKRKRLTRSMEFGQVKKQGRVYRGRLFTLSVMPVETGGFRVGFITSRKLGQATRRNRVRRRLREIVRRHQHTLTGNAWFVIIARSGAVKASYAELEAEWLRLAPCAFILAP